MKPISKMKYHFGIKIRIYPSDKQKKMIKKSSDASRFFYNYQIGLDNYIRDIYRHYGRDLFTNDAFDGWIADINKRMRSVKYCKSFHSFLNDKMIDSNALAYANKNHQTAQKNFFSGLQGRPTFHAKRKHPYEHRYQTKPSYKSEDSCNVRFDDKHHIRMPKLKSVKIAYVRPFMFTKKDYRFGTITVYKDALDHYYMSMQLGSDTPFVKPKAKTGGKLGFDLNTSDFLMDSNGHEVANPRFYQHQVGRLKRVQQYVSRRARHNKSRNLKDCKNYQKMRLKYAMISQHVKQQRTDFLQKLSTELIEKQDFLVGENLKSKNMLRNHHISKSISDVGWRSFLTMLSYKAELYGKTFVTVPPKNTTQTCNDCGYIMSGNEKLTLRDREWTCPNCNIHHVRDLNAAKNILDKGLEKISA